MKVRYMLIPLAAEFMVLMVSGYLAKDKGEFGQLLGILTFAILIVMGAYLIYDRIKSFR
jgi:hypothetical protein